MAKLKDKYITLRVTVKEKRDIAKFAKSRKLTVGTLLRMLVQREMENK